MEPEIKLLEYDKQDPGKNLRTLKNAVALNPMDTRYLYYLGREYGYLKNWNKTIEILEKYVALTTLLPEKADAYFMLAICYWNSQQGEKARVACLMAININTNFKAAILLMASISLEENAIQWRRLAETATNENTLFARIDFNNI